MIKNAIISLLTIYALQPIWIPGTSIIARAYANTGFFVILMIILWLVEEYINEKMTRHGPTTRRAKSARHSRLMNLTPPLFYKGQGGMSSE